MPGRAIILATVILAAPVLASTWSADDPGPVACRAFAFLVVVLFLVYALAVIAIENIRRPAESSSGGLWDHELDALPLPSDRRSVLDPRPEYEAPSVDEPLHVDPIPGGVLVRFGDIARLTSEIARDVELRVRFRGLGLGSPGRVILDFEGVEFDPPADFLAHLIHLNRGITRNGGLLVLCEVPATFRGILRVTELTQELRVAATSDEALAMTETVDGPH